MFGVFTRKVMDLTNKLISDLGKDEDFLEAACAAVALIAAADGSIEDSEREKAVRVISNHKTLGSVYKVHQIETCMESMFRKVKDASGRQELAQELDDLKGKSNGAQMADYVYLIAADVAAADGSVAPEETEVLKKLAKRLRVDPSKFEF